MQAPGRTRRAVERAVLAVAFGIVVAVLDRRLRAQLARRSRQHR